MEDVGLQQFAPSAFRATHPTALQQFPHTYPSATLASHLGADFEDHALQGFSAADLSDLSAAPQLQQPSFQPRPVPPHPPQHPPSRAPPQINSHHQQPSGHNGYKQPGGGLFGVLTPRPGRAPLSYQPPLSQASIQNQIQIHNQIPNQSQPQHNAIARLQAEQQQEFSAPGPVDQTPEKVDSHFSNLKLIQNPPNLQEWREKLFHVDDTIVLSEDEFNTYFPHVDNVYSHRSTQRYKRKPFISHYWDCRLKGRPPGTPKSDDPTKKKRKRTARERDLCDVKIKITEYFPVMSPEYAAAVQSGPVDGNPASNFFAPDQIGAPATGQPQILGVLAPGGNLPPGHPGATGARYYTIQRVNGNGANGKADGTAGPHKHTLDESDRVKKNSVQRHFMKEEKEKRKTQKTYHKKASGAALGTVKRHSKDSDLKLYGSCFCPFVQRIWIALEAKGIPYQYVEVDPYKKPESLLKLNPRGLVPTIQHDNFACYESVVLLEYLEDLNIGNALLPPTNPQLRAICRLWADHINRHIIPAFYKTLQAQEASAQLQNAEQLKTHIDTLVQNAHSPGPFFLGPALSFVDIHFAPWMLRLSRVLKPYRGWPDPEVGSRWEAWVQAIEGCDAVRATTSEEALYLDSYERYAENRPDTSQLANAINAGHPLP